MKRNTQNNQPEPKCEYCGCTNINCLARCPHTGLYFCNGKGSTSSSHIIHYLRTNHQNQIVIPDGLSFSKIQLKCYVCESQNIFELGFLRSQNNQSIFIACKTNCQFDQSLQNQNVDNSGFIPLVSNGQILPDVVNVPAPEMYEKVPMSRVIAVNDAIQEQLRAREMGENGENDDDNNKNQRGSLKPAQMSYMSRDQFVDIMKPFVQLETEETKSLEKSTKFRITISKWTNEYQCTFKAPGNLYRSCTLGSYLSFSSPEGSEKGYISKMSKSMNVDVKFFAPPLFANKKTTQTVNVVFNELPFERQNKALDKFRDEFKCMDNFIAQMILGQLKDLKTKNKLKRKPINIVQPPPEYFYELNQSQLKCIRVALSQRFTLIQGPPGTGKTTVIAVLALSLVRAGIKPILVCCQSNVATDFATKRISQTGVKVCRVLSSTREQVASDIDEYTTKALAIKKFGNEFQNLINSSNQNDHKKLTQLEIQVVRESDVVCTTCTSAGGARLSCNFNTVIFDESGQCVDPDILIPLVHGCKQAILVGDHKQLGPVIISRKSQRCRYDLPLMQRLILQGMRPSILKVQYRMHPGLSEFPSKAFYNGLLQNGVPAEKRRWPRELFKWPNPDIPMFFWNFKSREEYYEDGLSYVNMHEAGCIAVLLDAMYKQGVNASDIGVITPYAGQQAVLIDSLPTLCNIPDKNFFDELEIASVDAFQGREKNFIILSNVRANDQFDIGFLKDQRRLCVSLTRAKYGLIVIGCAETFSKNKLWCKFILHCIEKNAFVEGDLNSWKPSTFKPQISTEGEEEDEDDIQNFTF